MYFNHIKSNIRMETFQIVKINETQDGNLLVDARELHRALGSKKDFSNWIKDQLNYIEAVYMKDYTIEAFDINDNPLNYFGEPDNQKVRVQRKEYILKIDLAKEIAMIQRSEKGKAIRKYFIEAEKELRGSKAPSESLRKTKDEIILEAIQELQYRVEYNRNIVFRQKQEIAELKPQAEYATKVLQSPNTYLTTNIAKELQMGTKALNSLLHQLNVQYKTGDGNWVLYQKHIGKGFTKTRTHVFKNSKNETVTRMLTVWTEAGRKFIHDLIQKHQALETAQGNKQNVM